jgi:transposase InsO family protein
VDGFSRFVELYPAADNTASTVVNALMDWFKRYGIAKQFVSDNGTHFLNAVVTELSQRLLNEHHFTMVYTPWSNGHIERFNREIKRLFIALRSEAHLTTEAWDLGTFVACSKLRSQQHPNASSQQPLAI